MSLQVYVYVFYAIMSFGALLFFYVLIKDRIDIIRSIKPNNFKSFFGYYDDMDVLEYILSFLNPPRSNPFSKILFNIIGLFIWVPFWFIDKKFGLNIFDEKK